ASSKRVCGSLVRNGSPGEAGAAGAATTGGASSPASAHPAKPSNGAAVSSPSQRRRSRTTASGVIEEGVMRSWRGGVGMVDSGLGLLLGGAKKAKGSGLADGMASLYCDRRRRSGRVFRGSMQLAGAFRHTDSIVAVLGADDGSFVDVNPTFERVLGWHRDEVLGRRSPDPG